MDSRDVVKAMVFCAGYGTRLGRLTRETPKPMLLLQGRPMLSYILHHLRNHRFDEVAINLHFQPEMIRNHFGDGRAWGVRIEYSYEPQLLGTAGALKKMEAFLEGERAFLAQYGDILTDQDLSAMAQFHLQQEAIVTLLLHRRANSNSVVCLDSASRITSFLERPTPEQRRNVTSDWVNSGICMGGPELLREIPPGVSCDLPRDIFPKLVRTGRVFGFPLSGYRCAVDSEERFRAAEEALASGACRIVRSGTV